MTPGCGYGFYGSILIALLHVSSPFTRRLFPSSIHLFLPLFHNYRHPFKHLCSTVLIPLLHVLPLSTRRPLYSIHLHLLPSQVLAYPHPRSFQTHIRLCTHPTIARHTAIHPKTHLLDSSAPATLTVPGIPFLAIPSKTSMTIPNPLLHVIPLFTHMVLPSSIHLSLPQSHKALYPLVILHRHTYRTCTGKPISPPSLLTDPAIFIQPSAVVSLSRSQSLFPSSPPVFLHINFKIGIFLLIFSLPSCFYLLAYLAYPIILVFVSFQHNFSLHINPPFTFRIF